MSDTIELVRFRLQEGKTAAEWLKDNEKVSEWLKRQPGFRFRSLSETEDGEWVDMVHWENLAAAQSANERIMNEIGDAFETIAPDSVVCSHSRARVMLQG